MKDKQVFGYGSLVNRNTHDFEHGEAATLVGWRRVWRQRPGRVAAFLSVEPCAGALLSGLVATPRDWAALDSREHGYDRHVVAVQRRAPCPTRIVHLYVGGPMAVDSKSLPVLVSYLDMVVQGFLAEYGEEGVAGFFETTTGWDRPVLNDRTAPIYPRYQPATAAEAALTDFWLARIGAQLERL